MSWKTVWTVLPGCVLAGTLAVATPTFGQQTPGAPPRADADSAEQAAPAQAEAEAQLDFDQLDPFDDEQLRDAPPEGDPPAPPESRDPHAEQQPLQPENQPLDETPADEQQRTQFDEPYQDGEQRDAQRDERRAADPSQDTAWLGIYMGTEQTAQQQGVQVTQIYPAGPAARAGIRPGDLIVSIDGQQVATNDELVKVLENVPARSEVEVLVVRNGREIPLTIRTAARSAFAGQQRMRGGDRFYTGQYEQGLYDGPPQGMTMEAHRRLEEQHQRLEEQIMALRQEVAELREMLMAQQPQQQSQPNLEPTTPENPEQGQATPPAPGNEP